MCFFSLQTDLTYLKSFLNRIKSTSESFRGLLKNVHQIEKYGTCTENLKQSIDESITKEVNNLALFSPNLQTDVAFDLFDDELFLDDNDPIASISSHGDKNFISAVKFLEITDIDREDINQLCSIIEECMQGIELLKTNISHDVTRQTLVRDLHEFANLLFFMDEFVDLSAVIGELARKLDEHQKQQFSPLIVDILGTLFIELNAWITTIFVDSSSTNIHEFDASLIGSSKQLLMFISSD